MDVEILLKVDWTCSKCGLRNTILEDSLKSVNKHMSIKVICHNCGTDTIINLIYHGPEPAHDELTKLLEDMENEAG